MQTQHLQEALKGVAPDTRVVNSAGDAPTIRLVIEWRLETRHADVAAAHIEYCGTEAAANRLLEQLAAAGHQLVGLTRTPALVLG
jgi:hypothetical protein